MLYGYGMDVEALRWFQHVADGATVTEVAEIHRVSQPAVSRALARLEGEVATALLHKSGRVLRLTHAGAVFKRYVDGVLHQLDDGLAAVGELLDPETGTVVVAFQLSLGTWLVPAMIAGFTDRFPRVDFRLEHSDDALGSSRVAGGRVDLEFTSRRPRNPEVHWEPLLFEPLFLAVSPTHRLAHRKEVDLVEAAEDDFVMLRGSWELRSRVEELCAAAGFDPRVRYEVDDLPAIQGFVAAGLGVGIVPAPSRPGAVRTGVEKLVPLSDPDARREVGLTWSRERRLLPSAELFRQHVLRRRKALAQPSGRKDPAAARDGRS
jgi:LysR family transcriptional regulator, transcription activator of glutamate synthase operon